MTKKLSKTNNQLETLRIGWLNKSTKHKKYYKMKRPLGGVRRLKLDRMISYSAADIKRIAIEEFKGGIYHTLESDYSVQLGYFNGCVISDFENYNGKVCDIWDFCRARNMTLYQLNLFILTTPKNNETEEEKIEDNLIVLYHYMRVSKYSNELSYTECNKIDLHTCVLFDHFGEGPSLEEFDPMDYGHMISRIEKDNRILLQIHIEENSIRSYLFPSANVQLKNIHEIIHDTDEVQGICNGKFGIGFIPSCTDKCRPVFTWYKDGELYKKAEFLYWLSDVQIFQDGKSHIWNCSVTCQGNDGVLKSKDVTINN